MIFWQFRTSQRSLHNAPIFRLLLKVAVNGTHQCDFLNFCGGLGPQHMLSLEIARNIVLTYIFSLFGWVKSHVQRHGQKLTSVFFMFLIILAEGAIALSVTLSGGALFASWKLLQFPSSLIVKVILAIFMGASAQHPWKYFVRWWSVVVSVVCLVVSGTLWSTSSKCISAPWEDKRDSPVNQSCPWWGPVLCHRMLSLYSP